jgi:hypothetical protein
MALFLDRVLVERGASGAPPRGAGFGIKGGARAIDQGNGTMVGAGDRCGGGAKSKERSTADIAGVLGLCRSSSSEKSADALWIEPVTV